MSEDDCDSRTASVGLLKARNKDASSASQRTSSTGASEKRRSRKNRTLDRREIQDFVPKGTSFTSTSLAVDNACSSSPSSTNMGDTSGDSTTADRVLSPISRPASRGMAPSMNWNKLSKGTVRTALRGRRQADTADSAATASFEAVNGKYWRSRSTSTSSTGSGDIEHHGMQGQSDSDSGTDASRTQPHAEISKAQTSFSAEFSDMDSGEDTDGFNDIVLNLSGPPQMNDGAQATGSLHAQAHGMLVKHSNVLEAQNFNGEGLSKPNDSKPSAQVGNKISEDPIYHDINLERAVSEGPKAEAILLFRAKYNSDPITLADLTRKDLETQARYIFFDLAPENLDLNLPVRCIDCMKEGHLADICPSKECEHCGAWAVHESRFCPSRRRCQRCRERGHDADACTSPLKGSAVEEPCDFCGSSDHTECDCDLIWKLPKQSLASGRIFISISCSHCTSNRHLMGDCPTRNFPMNSSSFSLKHYDPSMFSNLNTLPGAISGKGNSKQNTSGYKIRGRAGGRSPSPESDGAFGRPGSWNSTINRSPPRGRIRFSNGIGRGRNFDDDTRRPQGSGNGSHNPNDYRRGYRDRDQHAGNDARQRSLSPIRPSNRQSNGANSWQPRGRGGGGGGGGGSGGGGGPRGRGRGGKGGSNRESYRPMPSAAHKAWDQHRF